MHDTKVDSDKRQENEEYLTNEERSAFNFHNKRELMDDYVFEHLSYFDYEIHNNKSSTYVEYYIIIAIVFISYAIGIYTFIVS